MRIYITALVVLGFVLFAHISGLDGLYYTVERYDVMMHFLGGVGIGFFIIALVRSYRHIVVFSSKHIILGVLIVGIVWELFEIAYNLTGYPLWTKLYYIDTVKDLIMDVLGGGLVTLFFKNKGYSYCGESSTGTDSLRYHDNEPHQSTTV